MSESATRLSTATARAIIAVAVVGALALATVEPTVSVAVLGGTALAGIASGFDGSLRRIALASALLPTVVLGTAAGIGLRTEPAAAVLGVVGAALGFGLGTAVVGSPSSGALRRLGIAAGTAAVVATGPALLLEASRIGVGLQDGSGLVGPITAIALATLSIAVGILAVPPAAFATPTGRESHVAAKNDLVRLVVVAGIVLAANLWIATTLGGVIPSLERLASSLTGSSLVRGLIALVAAAGVALTVFGLVTRRWWQWSNRERAIVPIVAGSVAGVATAFVLVVGAPVTPAGSAAPLAGGAVGALGATAVLAWIFRAASSTLPAPTTVIAAALGAGGVTVGALAGDGATGLEAVRIGAVPFVALAASLVAYDLGRYERGLAREVGATGATARPQLVRIAWSGSIAAVGVVVAAGGLWVATVLAPTLSVTATAGALAGVVAILAGARLLL